MQAAEFVHSYVDAWNRQDAKAIAEHLADNGTYMDVPVHQNMSRPEFITHLEKQFKLEAYYYQLSGEVLSGETTIAFQYQVFPRDDKNEPNQTQTWFGAEFITLSNGEATEIADYYEQVGQTLHSSPLAVSATAIHVQRYAKSGLSGPKMEQLKEKIERKMEVDKIYLYPDLTLPDLAEKLECTVNHVSQAINAGFGVSFFDYINEYRVNEAMDLLRDNGIDSRTVLAVALEVGFNSTSTFYVAFKKVTGKTPAEYRRSQTV
ncbi:MAG: AraC-like DNA-binding protein [Halioglobus sp.]|jgi:AraC-like DNA-binding protein